MVPDPARIDDADARAAGPVPRPGRWFWIVLAAGLVGNAVLFSPSVWSAYLTLGPWGSPALAGLVAVGLAVAGVPAIARRLGRAWDGAAGIRPRGRRVATAVVAVSSAAYLIGIAHGQGRYLHPYLNDEFSYLLQARQLAAGHGWMPAHPLGPFFDAFQVLIEPAYGSAYFPGTALLYVPGDWLGVPPWVTSVVIAAAVAAALFHVAAELSDPVWGALAVLLLWTDRPYLTASTMVMGQMPVLLAGLLATAAWLAWRRGAGLRWAAVTAALLAWAAVTRPVDAACFAIPIAVAAALRLRHEPPRRRWLTVAVATAAVAPLVALQLTLNLGMTGHLLRTPFQLYADRDYPGSAYGFHAFDPFARPASSLRQKLVGFDNMRPLIRDHTPEGALDRLFVPQQADRRFRPSDLQRTLVQASRRPWPLLLWLVPLAAAGWPTRRPRVAVAFLPIFAVLYAGYPFFLPHYVLPAVAALAVGVATGGAALSAAMPRPALARAARLFTATLVAGVAIAALPPWYPGEQDVIYAVRLLPRVDRALATLPPGPAVVLFAYSPARTLDEEPVYNVDAAWPDDARIVRANDLGPAADAALFRYYAERQPSRVAYRYDEANDSLTRLGPVTELARHGVGR